MTIFESLVLVLTAAVVFAALRAMVPFSEPDTKFWANSVMFKRAQDRSDSIDPEAFDPGAMIMMESQTSPQGVGMMKRALDIVLSLSLLVLTAPMLVLTALAVKLESKGPAIYRQIRVGENNRQFEILKFRSMVNDAERNGPQYAGVNDARVTRVGAFIRKYRIDEIPQAVNVLRGEMSFVGPRPERPEFVEELRLALPNYEHRHTVRPGITGWAQVKYEYAATLEGSRKKLRYDLYYILNQSILLDLLILLLTVRVAMFGLGSR